MQFLVVLVINSSKELAYCLVKSGRLVIILCIQYLFSANFHSRSIMFRLGGYGGKNSRSMPNDAAIVFTTKQC